MRAPVPHAEAQEDATRAYLTGQLRPSHPNLIAEFDRRSQEVVEALSPNLDLAYGPHPRQRYDLFRAAGDSASIAFFHAGYWQARDKSSFRFLAATWVEAGFNVAMVNYPLCPDVDLAALTEAARAFPPVFLSKMAPGKQGQRLIAAGHSAGAHIAVELALTDWGTRGLSKTPISAVIGLSGVYDLMPLIDTPLNDKLRLDPVSSRANSPIFRVASGLPPALFAAGALETDAFIQQNQQMGLAWSAAGNSARTLVVEGVDHFSLLNDFALAGSALSEAAVRVSKGP